MKNINKQRKALLMVLSFAMVIAVYLNWQYSKGADDTYILTDEVTQYINAEANIDEKRRGETLTIEEFATLSNKVNARVPSK